MSGLGPTVAFWQIPVKILQRLGFGHPNGRLRALVSG